MRSADSPEDRLLRLIKGKYRRRTEAKEASREVQKDTLLTDVSKKIFMQNKALRPLFSDSVNRVLAVILIILAGYLGYSLLFPSYRDLSRFIESGQVTSEGRERPAEDSASVSRGAEDFSVYSQAIRGKDLFSVPYIEDEEGAAKEPEIDVAGRFNLVGIIAGADPQAIIEDKNAKKTHYLFEGQELGEVKVVEITEGRVVLGYKDKEYMLVL